MTKYIASCYFSDLKAIRQLYGGVYRIPAVPRGGEPVTLEIKDKIQRSQEPSADGRTKTARRDLIEGRDIANDLIAEWTASTPGMTPQCHPGVWAVRDELPELNADGAPQMDQDARALWRPATAEEKRAMWAEDLAAARLANDAWADYLIRQGDVFAEDPKHRVFISDLMRVACRHYGKERDWLQELRDGDIKHCQYCTKSIATAAIVCPFCQRVVDIVRYAELQRKEEEAVEMAKGAASRPPAPVARPGARA